MNYIVKKKPGQDAVVIEHESGKVAYETIKEGVGGGYFTMCRAMVDDLVVDIWCDDEGLLTGKKANFYHDLLNQPIVGEVMVCLGDSEGESRPFLKRGVAQAVANWLNKRSIHEVFGT